VVVFYRRKKFKNPKYEFGIFRRFVGKYLHPGWKMKEEINLKFELFEACAQGDQVGPLFAYGVINKESVFNYRSNPHFRLPFSTVQVMHNFEQKIVWATFWAIFSPTHLVALLARQFQISSPNVEEDKK
jgi:hypothetical protein